MKPVLGVDIDGVVCEFFEAYNRWVHGMYDLPVQPTDRYDWYLKYPQGGRLWSAAHTLGIAEPLYLSAKPTPGAPEALDVLSGAWDIQFITYRPANLAHITNGWLSKNGMPYPVTHTDDKSSVSCDLYLDDHPLTISTLLKMGLPAWLFKREWNTEAWNTMPGVDGWLHVQDLCSAWVAA